MRRALALAAAGLVLASRGRSARRRPSAACSWWATRSPRARGRTSRKELPGWRVRQSTKVSRHAAEGDDVMRRYGDRLPRVIHASLGTNDDPRDVDGFRAAIRAVMKVAGGTAASSGRTSCGRRMPASATAGTTGRWRTRTRAATTCIVLNWKRMAHRHPEWLADDGVHVSADGYAARARATARLVRRCG